MNAEEAVEYGMKSLHGTTDIPDKYKDLTPLYMRFVNFADYCEKLELLSTIPDNLTDEDIKQRSKAIQDLDNYEKAFLLPIMGIQYNNGNTSEVSDAQENSSAEETDDSNVLHLMNAAAFVSKDPLKTSLFYEQKCGFKAAHLNDEAMPHIRLTRDNITIIVVEGNSNISLRNVANIKYDLFIYVTEPFLLYNELEANGVTIIEKLESADSAVNSSKNRQFVFEDSDGRHICVSLSTEVV